jgi:hypothetical protein
VIWVGASFIVVGFLLLAYLMRVPERAREAVTRSLRAVDDLRNPNLSEVHKEAAIQAHAGRLFALFLLVTGSTMLALGLPVGVVALLDLAGIVDLREVLGAALSWKFMAVATAAGIAVILLVRKLRR